MKLMGQCPYLTVLPVPSLMPSSDSAARPIGQTPRASLEERHAVAGISRPGVLPATSQEVSPLAAVRQDVSSANPIDAQ